MTTATIRVVEEKTCCQPALNPEQQAEALRRVDSIAEALFARTPRRCSSCGSTWVHPMFWAGVDLFGCAWCSNVMSGRGD